MKEITEQEGTCDVWSCPFGCPDPVITIIQDAVLKDDYRELLCGCLRCNELFIRQYKFEKTVLLERHNIHELTKEEILALHKEHE